MADRRGPEPPPGRRRGAWFVAALPWALLAFCAWITADFVGLEVEDRFLYGCGMDIAGYWRNLPALYAMKEN